MPIDKWNISPSIMSDVCMVENDSLLADILILWF